MEYLDFKTAKCKNCYRCLRECPVKAIKYEDHQAKIIVDRCILCGTCTAVCPQNAKKVHSELDSVEALLKSGQTVIASVAPSFVSSFGVQDFSVMKIALAKLGFADAEETAVGANAVTKEYANILKTGEYKNFITSACPAINRMIQIYYPNALKYLAPVASPMVAHARLIRSANPNVKIVFIGPCIAKKKEAADSGIIDAVLTFEDLEQLFLKRGISLNQIAQLEIGANNEEINRAKYYPISRGIIKSFSSLPGNYEYVAVDGVKRCFEVLEDIDSLSNMFIEVNCCEYSCINGPCSLKRQGKALKSNEEIRKYVARDLSRNIYSKKLNTKVIDLAEGHPKIRLNEIVPNERTINQILAKTGKFKPEDMINCGACGYSSCREKAIAVANGYADIEMCIPYMRSRAETMSFEIIQNSPNGIIVLDTDYKLLEINNNARAIFGIDDTEIKGKVAFDMFPADDYVGVAVEGKKVVKKKIFIQNTKKYAELTITLLKEHKIMFGVYTDITGKVEYNDQLASVKLETMTTTDDVIKKQMRVAQEIASLLGETTAETKIALLKLKKTLQTSDED
ncbi:MAG: [Fe-Fe] hydrogenase large subunit C-terminal domain-containing protein [Clostridia bacterium]